MMMTTITISIIITIIIIKRIMKINCYYYYIQRCLCYIILSTNSCKLTKNYIKRLIKGLNKNNKCAVLISSPFAFILFF